MIHDVVAYGDLKYRCVDIKPTRAWCVAADDLWFACIDEEQSKNHSRTFEWSSDVGEKDITPHIKISVVEAPIGGSVDHINITLRDCELDQFPTLKIEEVEE